MALETRMVCGDRNLESLTMSIGWTILPSMVLLKLLTVATFLTFDVFHRPEAIIGKCALWSWPLVFQRQYLSAHL